MNAYERRQELRIAKGKLRKQRRVVERMIQSHHTFTRFEEAHIAAHGIQPHIEGDYSGYHYVSYKGKTRRMSLKMMEAETRLMWAEVHERRMKDG